MPLLPLPSYLQHSLSPTDSSLDTYSIRKGEVIELIYPDDKRNRSKRVVEYRVSTQCRNPDSNTSTTREYHCTQHNPLGGVAESLRWTLRADPAGLDKNGFGKGSKVLVLCIDGAEGDAIIISGIVDQAERERLGRSTDVDNIAKTLKDNDLQLLFRFNGLTANITKNGDLSVQRFGPTDIDGKVSDDSAARSRFIMAKDGSIVLGGQSDRDKPGNDFNYSGGDVSKINQRIFIDNVNKLIRLVADKGIRLGDATNALPLFEDYRYAESDKNLELSVQLQRLVVALNTAAGLLQSIQVAHAVPITGPVAAAPLMGQVGAQLLIAAQAAGQMTKAIQEFEKQPSNYLSKKNYND